MRTCKHGHRMTKANVNPSGQCRQCKRAAARRWLKRHRQRQAKKDARGEVRDAEEV
jgi:hypothetical protein